MCWLQILTSAIQFLCLSIPEILWHMTLKGRAELSAGIFARLFLVFPLVLQEFDNRLNDLSYDKSFSDITLLFFTLSGRVMRRFRSNFWSVHRMTNMCRKWQQGIVVSLMCKSFDVISTCK